MLFVYLLKLVKASIGKSNNNEKKNLESDDFKEFYTNISSNLKTSNLYTKPSNLKNGQNSNKKDKNVRILGSFSGPKKSIKNKLRINLFIKTKIIFYLFFLIFYPI
jgi:uncharacterized protein YdaT